LGSSRVKQQKYDVAAIGAGMGGLCAAALLAHQGYRTLVVEKLPFVGGRASSFNYRGFTLPTGSLYVETGGVVESIFKEVGADFPVRPFPIDLCFRIGGKDYLMAKKGGLKGLISNFAPENETRRLMAAVRRAFAWNEPSDFVSVRDWLLEYTQNDQVLAIFKGLSTYQCVNFCDMPASEFMRQLKLGGGATAGAPPQGFLVLMEQLVKAIEAKGSHVWTGCRAKHIIVEEGVTKGIVVERGGVQMEIAAKAVISNAGPHQTVELAGSENFDKGYLKELREKVRPLSYIGLAISSDRPLVDFRGVTFLPEGRRQVSVMCTSLVYPEYAPLGKHLLQAWAVPDSSFLPLDPKKEIDMVVQDLREAIPRFDREAEILHVSYWQKDWPMYRALPGVISQKTPIENLYNVGDGVAPLVPLGLPGCAQSARMVVDDIKQRIKPDAA
jgi:phytoene dehydrogenase-like protein